MGQIGGFTKWPRKVPDKQDVDARLRGWNEFDLPWDELESRQQGGRCMDCGIPFCQQGCPLGNQIPDFNDLVFRGRWKQAYESLCATNNFPEFTGRVCPAPCEAACVLEIGHDAVTIEQIEKVIIERAFEEGWVQPKSPRERTGRRVAIVGSGPAGLAAAAQLNSAGHHVTVFEAADRLGGLLRYGIPSFKSEKWVIDRRVRVMVAEGIDLVTRTRIGESPTWDELRDRFDSVLIAIGSRRPRDLPVPGRDLDGVHFAMEYLTQQNRVVERDDVDRQIHATGKRVVVIGGGDTGSDCVGTALRQGAESVLQIELMPPPPMARPATNPWPQWPMIYRTSSSHEEGGERDFAVMTKRLSGIDGAVSALHAVRVRNEPDVDGNPAFTEVEGSDLEIPTDLVLLAMGFAGPKTDSLVTQLGVELDPRGNVVGDESFKTNVKGVYAAGDARRGQSLVVWAISEGREAARCIDSYLRNDKPSWLPTRGHDRSFGGR